MHYELWDVRSRNMLADSESEALAAVREMLAINEPDMADELALAWRDGSAGGTVAEGATLASRAQQARPGPTQLPR